MIRLSITLLALMMTSYTNASSQAEVNLDSTTFNFYEPSVQPSFGVNSKLGRAYVYLTMTSMSGNHDNTLNEVIKVKMDGLTFDETSRSVVLNANGEKIICATEESFLGIKHLKNSGECTFKISKELRQRDDGFNLRNHRVVKVSLDKTI